MRVIENKYEIGEDVYLKTDVDQKLRIVSGFLMRGDNSCLYELSCGVETKWHYEFEICVEKNVLITK